MSAEPLDLVLEQLARGDFPATEEVFRTYEGYLRAVVRKQLPRQLRAKFDSADIVQSVWAHVLDGFRDARWRFANRAQLRAFLVKVACNRITDRRRHFQTAADHEQSLRKANPERIPVSGQPRPSEVVQAEDLWTRMLTLCAPEHRQVLELRRQGLTMSAIAAATGFHEDSVRRILRQLARRLALDRGSIVSGSDNNP
jgi:RNA polymerase sigma-70 factor (ECF subfamily)